MVVGTSQDIKNKILVVNSTTESPNSVLSKIIGKDDLTLKPIYSDEIQAADWQIDNNVEQLGNLCEALILVFDATKTESFAKLNNWSNFVEECSPNVLLCAGIGKSENKNVFNEWCMNNGLEYVEIVDPSANKGADAAPVVTEPSADSEEDETDDPFGGAEGKDRIIEALISTMWENMKQKAQSRRLEDQFSSMLNLGEDDDDDETERLDSDIAQGGPPPTFDPLNFDEDLRLARGEFRHATDEISQNLRALQSFLSETESHTEEGVAGEVEPESDNNTEANVEQFESALTGLRRLRENAQQLPDAQRKALAAHVISMLFPDEEDWQ